MGGLRIARDLLRPVIDGPFEYRVRRGIGRALPPVDASGPAHLFHACAWKTGSQWVRLILSDPRILRYGGHAPFIWAHLRDRPGDLETYRATKRTLLLTGYGPPDTLRHLRPTPMRGVFVIRDPRVLLASWITSTRYTHRPNPEVCAHRRAMDALPETEVLAYAIRAFLAEFGPVLDGWRAPDPQTLPVRFEELTGPDGEGVWHRVLEHLGLPVPGPVLRAVLNTYRIEALSGPPAQRAEADKYALRGQRAWKDLAQTPQDLALLEPLFAWARSYGYRDEIGQ